MRKIAILYGQLAEFDYNDRFIVQSITDWTEVDDETYSALHDWCRLQNRRGGVYHIIEQVITNTSPLSFGDILKAAQREAEAQRKARATQKAKDEAARQKRAAQETERKRKKLEQLKKELGEV